MINLSLNELQIIEKSKSMKDHKSISKERLLNALNESESVRESEKNFDGSKIKKIRKKFDKLRGRFSKPKMKEVRRSLYEIESKKKSSHRKNKSDWTKSFWIRKNFSKLKKYYDYDDIKYKGIRTKRCKKFI